MPKKGSHTVQTSSSAAHAATAAAATTPSVAAPSAAPSSRPPMFPRAQSSASLTSNTALNFMIRAVYQYLSQFGFEETAEHLKAEVGNRFEPSLLSSQDEAESHLRCSMYRTFTLTAAATPDLHESAEIVLDDLNLLQMMGSLPRSMGSTVFNIERELRIAACTSVLDKKDLFDAVLSQYFNPDVTLTEQQALAVDEKIANDAKVSDVDLRKHHLYYRKIHLIEYQKAKSALAKLDSKSPIAKNARTTVDKFETEHSRENLQYLVRVFLKGLLEKLHVQGAVMLEKIMKAMLQGELVIEGDEEEMTDPVEEATAAQQTEEGEEPEEEVEEEEEEEPIDVEEEEESEEEKTEMKRAPPVKVKETKTHSAAASVASSRRPTRAASNVAASTSSAAPSSSLASRVAGRAVPEVARQLQAASDRLKNQGDDPLADTIRNTQALSKKRKSEAKEREELTEDEEAAEEGEARYVAVPKGRPTKYDRAAKSAEKVEFSEDDGAEAGGAEEEEDEPMVTPFVLKKTGGKRPTQLAIINDPGQRGRPQVHRHATDRATRRIPWSVEEIQKLTDGVMEFASERKKWSLILTKYNEFFQDRTVVDLKDKWRNLKGKVAAATQAKRARRVDDADMEEIED